MNKFGGDWTESKIEILVEYAVAYLTIMKKYAKQYGWKLLYFDGFAGSGFIKKGSKENQKLIVGAARRILEIETPRSFDMYYFVEKDEENVTSLESLTKGVFEGKNIHVVNEDCNTKIEDMSRFLTSQKGKDYKT